MKKIFTLIAVATMAISVQAENKTVQFKVGDGLQNGGEVKELKDDARKVVASFGWGTTDNWKTEAADVKITYGGVEYEFNTYFTTNSTNGNGGADLAVDASSPYNYFFFVPQYSGTLIVALQNGGTNNTEKPMWCYENGEFHAGTIIGDGTLNIEYDGHSDIRTLNGGSAVNGGLLIPVTGGKQYTFSVNGSKVRWMGFIYEYDPDATGIEAVKAEAAQNGAAFNLAGQQVDSNFKGVVVKNGKKMIQK